MVDSVINSGDVGAYSFSNADGKQWLVPVKGMSVGLELYQPSGVKGIMLKRLLPLLHRLPQVRRIAGIQYRKVSLIPEILKIAEEALEEKDLQFSVFGGTPSVHQKVTIQFYRGDKILGYAKVSSSASIEALFFHEQRILSTLWQKGITEIPRCVCCTRLSTGDSIFIQTTQKTPKSTNSHSWLNIHEHFLCELHERTRQKIAFEKSDYSAMLNQLEQILPRFQEKHQSIISQAINSVRKHYQHRLVDFSAYHADFTPWNMAIEKGQLFVFDWEYAQLTYPQGLDRYHFYIQQAIHVNHFSSSKIIADLRTQPWVTEDGMRLYLLDIIARFSIRESDEFSDSFLSVLDTWCELLSFE